MKFKTILAAALSLTVAAALLVSLAAATANAASPGYSSTGAVQQGGKLQPVVVTDAQHDLSLPLSVLSRQAQAQPARPVAIDAINKQLPNKHPELKYLDQLKEEGIDPFDPRTDENIQSGIGVPYAPNAMPSTIMNWKAHTNIEGYYPPDTVGDIGYDPVTQKKFYVQWVNVRYAVWDVTSGTPVMVISPTLANALWSGFGGPCQTQNSGDPIVLFDQLSNRWFMSQFAVDSAPYYQCIAISQTADPTGAWYRYGFLYDATKMNDYPHFGVWPDGYYMTTNQFNNASTWGGAGVAVFERDKMLLGQTARMVKFDLNSVSTDFGGMLPSDWDGSTLPPAGSPNYFAEVDDNIGTPALGPDAMRLWKFHVDWTNTANSTFGVNGTPNYTLTVASFDLMPCTVSGARNCVPQLNTTIKLDVIGDRLMHRSAYRNINGHEALVLNHTVNAGSGVAGIRWYEVRDLGTSPVIYQQSTYGPDSTYRWMGSVAMDHVGNIALGFSASDATIYPAIRYAGRLASDPLNTLAQGEATIINGTGSQTGTAYRWGDYSALTLDPVDDCTFYYSQEYLETTGNVSWVTRVGSFKFANCSLGPQGVLTGDVTNSANSAPIVGAQVKASSSPTETFTAYSNFSGTYNLILPVTTYTVDAAAYGFVPASITGVSVVSGTTTTQNIALTPAATYVISGYVTDSATGLPLIATVNIEGVPFNPPTTSVSTNPANGFYSVTLAGNQAYTFTVSALLHTNQVRGLGTPVSNQTQNFALVATTQNGALIGYVKDYYTNLPLANAQVTVQPGGQVTTTNASGYFQVFNLTPGYYTGTASLNLYSPVSIANIQIVTSNLTSVTFLLPRSQLNFAPATLQKTLTLGQVVTDAAGLVISNTGIGALTYDLQEQVGGFTPSHPAAGNILVVAAVSGAQTQAITTALQALGYTYDVAATRAAFEAMTAAQLLNYQIVIYSGPTDTSTTTTVNASNTLLMAYLDAGGRVMHVDNDEGYYDNPSTYYQQYLQATFGGDDPGTDQSITGEDIMAGVVTNVNNDSFPDYFTPGVDGIRIFRYTAYNNGAGVRTARNGYKTLYLSFDYQYLGGNTTVGDPVETEVMLRSLNFLLSGSTFDAVPWISEAPISGTLGTNAAQSTQLVWNASVPEVTQPGIYTASLKINNNDPNAQSARVPVALTVLPAATQGLLTGVVSTTGVCDVNLASINGAQVLIQGSAGFVITLTTSAAGSYGYYVDSAQSPFTVTASYLDHPTTAYSVNVTGGVTATQNFTLRLQKPCISNSPNSLQATAQLGNAAPNQTVFVTSSGALPLDFNVFEVPSNLPVGGGPDAFGYTWITSTFNYIPANGSGTALNLTDDSEANVVSPFSVPFYGGSSTNLRVGNNGAILFNATTGDVDITNAAMASAPDNFIAPFWDDLDDETGNVYWLVTGTAPNRKLVVEWYNRPHYNGVGAATFEAVLFENGNILYQYLDTDFGNASYSNGVSATSGTRGVSAANSLQYSFNQAKLTNGLALCFVKPGNAPCDAVDVPWLTVVPTSTVGLTGTPPSSQQLTVGFDSASLPLPGTYTANLLVTHNAPQPAVNIPVTFNVTAPATYGQVNGTVTGLAVCDAPGAPLQGAAVAITGGTVATATTAANGQYSYYLLGGSAYTLTVSNPGYVSQSTIVTVTQSQTTTTNFDLRLIAPCQSTSGSVAPSVLQPGQQVTQTFVITNAGTASLNWDFTELAAPAKPVTLAPFVLTAGDGRSKFTPNTQLVTQAFGGSSLAPTADISITESSSQSIVSANSVSCNNTAGHADNSYYRVFDLPTFGITGEFKVSAVEIGVESAAAGGTDQPITVNLYTLNGAFILANLTPIGSASVNVTDQSLTHLTVPVTATAPAGAKLVVEIFTPNGQTAGNFFFIGSNNLGETAPSYIRATACGLAEPATTTSIGFPGMQIVMNVHGSTGPSCSANALPWVSTSPSSGTTAPASSSNVGIVFNSTGLTTGVYTGTLCLNTNDTLMPQTLLPVKLTVASPAQLTVNVVGNGTVGQNPPPSYVVGQVVTLTATPATGWSFAGWSGDLSGTTNPITITLTSDKVVTATFTANPVNLTVNVVGNGTVTPVPAAPYLYGAVVTLTANANLNWAFSGWSGDLTGTTNPITITLTGDKVVTATFASTCVPVAGVDFTYAPTAPKVNKIVTFNGTALTGTTPITYSWNFGDGSAVGSGSPITHLFPITLTTHSYTVTLTAANACGTAPVLKSLTVQPQTIFLPLVTK
jgi:uncharacterized repeat protein (TIGR02543 family)